ncbi:MAG: L-aspartate oxidase, partial [Caulobacteraceae bacterium]|nr:L-aspartate oxidase [Caulobacteraceae bacterium]
LRRTMSEEAGVVRTAEGLCRAIAQIDRLESVHGRTADLVAARLTVACALSRAESLGAHYRSDAPGAPAEPKRTLVRLADLDLAAAPCMAAE